MHEEILFQHIGRKIKFDFPPGTVSKEPQRGVGILRHNKDLEGWEILQGHRLFAIISDEMIEQIEFDTNRKILSLDYFPDE